MPNIDNCVHQADHMTSDTLRDHHSRELHLKMSPRRSARVASSSVPIVPESTATNGTARYTKVEKAAPAPKKRKTKASTTAPEDEPSATSNETDWAVPSLPATPLPKKRRIAASKSPTKPPPFTPTPAGVGLIASSSLTHPLESLASLQPRPAEPHATNAPISTPGGSRVVAYQSSPIKPEDPSPVKKRKAKEVVPPELGSVKPPTSNSDTLLKDAEAFLISVDPKLRGLIEKHHCKMFSPEGLSEAVDPFTALASSIMGQQVREVT
jgi:DNA-3-methyladenine glycosylase II